MPGKNQAVYPPIISRRGRSCMAIDIKQTFARLHLEEPMTCEDCFFIDWCSAIKRKEINVSNIKFTRIYKKENLRERARKKKEVVVSHPKVSFFYNIKYCINNIKTHCLTVNIHST